MSFKDLDYILETRKTPDVPEFLSARIIAAARRGEYAGVRGGFSLGGFAGGLIDRVVEVLNGGRMPSFTPQAAWAMAAVVVFAGGAVLGGGAELSDLVLGYTPGDVASFMMIEDRFVVSEWV